MAFRDFVFPAVMEQLGLSYHDTDLSSSISPVELRPEVVEMINDGAIIAFEINTEKARSEFVIAPILLEARRLTDGAFGIFSGVEFNVDVDKKLVGVVDFLLTRPAHLLIISTLVIVVTEVKNDNVQNAYGQCIATMRAAQLFNQRKGYSTPIYGVTTTGSDWKFLQLNGDAISFDRETYYLQDVTKIIAIIKHMVESVALVPAAA